MRDFSKMKKLYQRDPEAMSYFRNTGLDFEEELILMNYLGWCFEKGEWYTDELRAWDLCNGSEKENYLLKDSLYALQSLTELKGFFTCRNDSKEYHFTATEKLFDFCDEVAQKTTCSDDLCL